MSSDMVEEQNNNSDQNARKTQSKSYRLYNTSSYLVDVNSLLLGRELHVLQMPFLGSIFKSIIIAFDEQMKVDTLFLVDWNP